MLSRRLAALDVGTNNVQFIIADVAADGSVTPVFESAEITRLGEGSLEDHTLKKDPMARTVLAVSEAANKATELGAEWAGAVATSAARDAKNGRAFMIMAQAVGAPLSIITGDEEADLAFLSVTASPPAGAAKQIVMLDIGGGSTELAIGSAQTPEHRVSLNIGAVRLTEKHVQRHPLSKEMLAELRGDARLAFSRAPVAAGEFSLVGVAGTITTLASVQQKLASHDPQKVHGSALDLADLEQLTDDLAKMTLDARKALPGMEAKRADVIVAGAAIALEAMIHLGADQLFVSNRGVHWGLLHKKIAGS
ncbi:MAG: Ppx/GppA family phosphatase [Deltaproteobacteria bacterium]|nr:Ppx/GppA family phosphatase [Deltaproteobacteria bacterium]